MIDSLTNSALVFLIALTCALVIVGQHQVRLGRFKEIINELPKELKAAKLFCSERLLVITWPFDLFGRVDQIWQRSDGHLVIADTKTRRIVRYYFSDQLQLTGYAFLLKYHPDTKGLRIAPYGYLRIPQGRKAIYIKVPLLSEQAYRDHLKHYQALQRGTARPRPAVSPLICKGCGHIDRCPTPLINRS
jgi:RecB family exonuclease